MKVYEISNGKNLAAVILDVGCVIQKLLYKGRDVVTGYKNGISYVNENDAYHGALVGRVCGRIGKGTFDLNGTNYQLAINNGSNSLHGGLSGWNVKTWDLNYHNANSVSLSYISKDDDEGFPCTLKVTCKYLINSNDELVVDYSITNMDQHKSSPLNLTNHSYFNLGSEWKDLASHKLKVFSKYYLETDAELCPTGVICEAKEEDALDFCSDYQNLTYERLKSVRQYVPDEIYGLDHCFCFHENVKDYYKYKKVVELQERFTKLEVFTDLPGVVIYTANWFPAKQHGDYKEHYAKNCAIAIETCFYPDFMNHANLKHKNERGIIPPNTTIETKTAFKFSSVEELIF